MFGRPYVDCDIVMINSNMPTEYIVLILFSVHFNKQLINFLFISFIQKKLQHLARNLLFVETDKAICY